MPNLTARLSVADQMSASIERIAQAGMSMVEQFDRAGDAASRAMDGLTSGLGAGVSSVEGVATSVTRLQTVSDRAAASTDALSQSMNGAATTQEALATAMEKAAQTAEELADNENVSAETKEELTRASEAAEEAMQELTAAQQRAEQAMADYDQIVASGSDDLEEMERAAQAAADATAELDAANDRAANATEELSQATERAADEAEQGSKRGIGAAEALSSALAAAGITQLVHEMGEAFMEASAAAAEFEVATMKISTIADTAQVSLSTISGDLLALSKETGQSVAGLSEATYSALSASVDTASAVQFTGTATKLAAGGFTSSATAVDVLTTALNAYGLEASEAESISDMLITTQNLGKTTVDELASSVGKVIPLASAYGVQMDNLSAAYAELTKGGIATAESTTYLKGMLTELGDSGSTVAGILAEQTGMGFADLMEAGYSLGDVLDVLGTAVGGNATEFSNLWSSTEAGIGALALYNAGAEQFNTTLDAMQNSVGATQTAYETMTDTTAHAQEELSNAASNLQIAIGQNINPLMEKLYGAGTKILNFMSDFATEHPIVTKALIGIGAGIAAVALGLGGIAAAAGIYNGVMAISTAVTATFGITLSAALWPITAIAAAIAAVVAVGLVLADVFGAAEDETAGMTATTREQYYELQDLNAEYERACEEYGETSEEALRLKYEVDDLSAAFEANRQTVEEFTAEVDALCQSVTQLSDDFDSALTDINAQEVGSLALIQKYQDLTEAAELTGAQQKELEAVTKKLSESYPDLAAQLDNATISAEDYVAAMKRACEQEAEEQRQQQAQQAYVDALAKRAELTEEIAKAQENVNLEQERMDNMSGWTHFWTGGEWDDLEAYQAALEELQAAEAENDALIAQIEQGWEDIAEAETAAADECVTAEEAVATAYEQVQTKVEELCAAYDEAYQAALESFEGQFGLFDEAQADMDATVANAQAALDSQLAYWDSYAANLEVLKNTSAEDLGITQENYDALMALAQDGSEEAAGLAQSMADAINSGNTEAVAQLATTVGEVSAKQQEIAAMTADWQTDFTAQMDAIEQEMQDTIDGMNLSDEAAASASATISSYADSIRAGKSGAVAAAQEVANAVSAALASANTTVNVRVNSSAAGHAHGTTNAESIFVAGENGPELVARPTAAYATGTTNSADYFIAGENGPELIVGEQGSTVFPTQETDRLIDALNTRRQPLQVFAGGGGENGGSGGGLGGRAAEQVKRILLEIAGSGAIEVNGSGGVDRETVLEILMEHLKPVLMQIIQSEIYEEGELAYEY